MTFTPVPHVVPRWGRRRAAVTALVAAALSVVHLALEVQVLVVGFDRPTFSG